MNVFSNFLEYRKYTSDYKNWRDNQELNYKKRVEYLKQNPEKVNNADIQRGKNLLHAIDIMDEYSQSNAEDMEVSTDMVSGQVVGLASTLGMLGGFGLLGTKFGRNFVEKVAGRGNAAMIVAQILPSIIGLFVAFAASFPVIKWATEAKISSSRRGRFEAMRNDLNNPAIFATLTPEQIEQAKEKSKDIELDANVKKRMKIDSKGLNPFESFKVLKKMYSENDEYIKQKKEFDRTLSQDQENNFNSELSEDQILKAKKDKQILADLVRKIDIASQDYAENTELVTNSITTLSLAGGGLVGWLSNKVLNSLKLVNNKAAVKLIPFFMGISVPLAFGLYGASVQKQASRIGRYKVKQEMLNNPESLVYVDEQDSNKISNIENEKKERINIFKFIPQMIKDNTEYKKYRKTKLVEELKLHKAIEGLDLTKEQEQDAKTLQMNVFKTFNKVDEKSQTYSESVEAVGKMGQEGVSVFGSLIATVVSSMRLLKMLDNPQMIRQSGHVELFLKTLMPFGFVFLPLIALDIITTKAQKKASRIADMLALKELDDYRHYAGYKKSDTVEKISDTEETNLIKIKMNKR